jgi:hypothetical protein
LIKDKFKNFIKNLFCSGNQMQAFKFVLSKLGISETDPTPEELSASM